MSDKTGKVLKRTRVDGKKYELPAEDVEIQKLVKKGLSLSGRISALTAELDAVKLRLAEMARGQNHGLTEGRERQGKRDILGGHRVQGICGGHPA